ncbi:MAG: undecaprenyldiphospho-muramoylpentapeptide beta-N-acetylglucosaminyltransferase [Flavobacteriaceae bacterium]
MNAGAILLAAGGTGGHLFPAEALAAVLAERGVAVSLVTDRRVEGLSARFPGGDVHSVSSATPSGKGLAGKVSAALALAKGFLASRELLKRLKPAAVVGFGGYPSVPPVLAAAFGGIATILQEQNAVMGRANRFLAGRVDRISTAFPKVQLISAANAAKCVQTGVPVRPAVRRAAEQAYRQPAARGRIRLLVFGGSQGARAFSDLVPEAVALVDEGLRKRLDIVQQCRAEDIERVAARYREIGVSAETAPFFANLPQRMADAHLIVSRSGASTVAELAVIGRPAILVPLPGAIDNDQLMNARAFVEAGGGWLAEQAGLDAATLAGLLSSALAGPAALAAKAQAAKSVGNPRAAEALADLVLAVAGR